MKLLICTQVVDSEDPVLGFFVSWIQELAEHVERIEVICLKSGRSDLPKNVRVHSLRGGIQNTSIYGSASIRRFRESWRFLSLVWRLRGEYDAVFVHMNQEYVLLAGWLWVSLGKRVSLWRNHYAGSWLTDVAASFCTTVFCTSKHSYTAKYKKTILMPVGVDTNIFSIDDHVARKPHSILFLARMSPSKRPEMLIDALATLAHDGADFTATLVGSPLPRDAAYYEHLQEKVASLGLADRISFVPAIPNAQTPALYRAHDIFVNCSPSGMFDKTLFEATACGCRVLSSSKDFAELAGASTYFDTAPELAARFSAALALPADERENQVRASMELARQESLTNLGNKLSAALSS